MSGGGGDNARQASLLQYGRYATFASARGFLSLFFWNNPPRKRPFGLRFLPVFDIRNGCCSHRCWQLSSLQHLGFVAAAAAA